MARRTRARATGPKTPAPQQSELVTTSVTTQIAEDTFTYYANYAEVACVPHDFAIMFARMPAKLPPEKMDEAKAGNVTLTCDVQIILPITLIDGLIRALTTQKAVYEQRYGAIHEPGGGPDAQASD